MVFKNTVYIFNEGDKFSREHSLDCYLEDADMYQLINNKIIKQTEFDNYHWNITGFTVIKNKPVIVFPKKFNYTKDIKESAVLLKKALTKFAEENKRNSEEVEFLLGNNGDETSELALAFYFFDDFKEYGLINRKQTTYSNADSGHIIWGKTVNKTDPLFVNKSPYYPNPIVKKTEAAQNTIIQQIHKYILQKCAHFWGWIENINEDLFNGATLPFSNTQLAINYLQKELRVTYISREVNLIKKMICFLKLATGSESKIIRLSYYTSYVHVMWESVCSALFNNKYDELKYLIPKTTWKYLAPNNIDKQLHQIPDILSIDKDNLYILDAKYYDTSISIPQWRDTVKQYVYYVSLKEEIKYRSECKSAAPNINNFKNIFLLPGEQENLKKIATISTSHVTIFDNIKAYSVNVKWAFFCYVNNIKIPLTQLD